MLRFPYSPAVLVPKASLLALSAVAGGSLLIGCAGGGEEAPQRSAYVDATLPPGGLGLYAEGVLARKAGDTARAEELLLQATRRDNQLIMANQVLGDLYTEREDYSQAERFFQRLLQLDPATADNYFRLGFTQEQLDRFRDAVSTYMQGLELEPDDAAGNFGAGRSYLALGEPQEAETYLEAATQSDPQNGAAWLALGRARDNLRDLAAAEAAYRRAMETLPEPDPSLIENLGINLVHQGRGSEAIALLQRTVEAEDTPRTRELLGDAYLVADQLEEAVQQYDQALSVDPEYLPAINAKGSARILQYQKGLGLDENLRQEAIDLWQRSLEINPDQPDVRAAIEQYSQARLFQ